MVYTLLFCINTGYVKHSYRVRRIAAEIILYCYSAVFSAFSALRATRRSSSLETTIEHAASPVMLSVVRPISKILSTPATRAIPSIGSPTLVRTIASITMPAPGTPAVPIEASVAVSTIVIICANVRSMP